MNYQILDPGSKSATILTIHYDSFFNRKGLRRDWINNIPYRGLWKSRHYCHVTNRCQREYYSIRSCFNPGVLHQLSLIQQAEAAKIYWSTEKHTLYTKRTLFRQFKRHNGHCVVEYNDPILHPVLHVPSASKTKTQQKFFEVSPDHLHYTMAHTSTEAISKLPSAVKGLKLT